MTQDSRKEFALHTFSERPLQLIADDVVYEKPQQLSFRADDDVCYYIRWRLKLEGETENMGVCTKERNHVAIASVLVRNLAKCSRSMFQHAITVRFDLH